MAARGVASCLKSSLGPKGMDKMLVSQDGEVLVTNDGATIVEKMDIEHPTARLMVELSQSQDNEIGDGTTGVVVLAGALLEQAMLLVEKGIHPLAVSEGFDKACEKVLQNLDQIHTKLDLENQDNLINGAITSLGSKIVSKCQKSLAKICVDAVLSVLDKERNDVNFELIKIQGKVGGSLEDTILVQGIVLDKEMSHPQMDKEILDAKICILTCPFEPPKPKTKYNVDVKNSEDYKKLYEHEQNYFKNMVQMVKDSGANLVVCQWGFDDEANHLLMMNKLPAIRWVGGQEIELIALATGGRIIPRFSEIKSEKLGRARVVRESSFGTENNKLIVIEDCQINKAVTIVIRGGSTTVVDEAHRCIHDALCVVRNMLKDPRIVYGGGASEVSSSLVLNAYADSISSTEQYAIRGFADALEQIPICLAENSGFSGIEYVANLKAQQAKENNPYLGVNCMRKETNNMKLQNVYESLQLKKQQVQLANQVVKMILKIDEVIESHEY
jgi:T-complex protein 1 subunit epsilon